MLKPVNTLAVLVPFDTSLELNVWKEVGYKATLLTSKPRQIGATN